MVTAHPLIGVGPGRARFFWTDAGGHGFVARYAHDEYLQLLVELGFVGLTGLLILLIGMVVTVVRGRRGAQVAPALWAGAVAAFAVLVVHSGFDYLWQIPAIPLTGALLVGLASPGTTRLVLDRQQTEDRPQLKEEPCEESR
jgi:O-antigen ligase